MVHVYNTSGEKMRIIELDNVTLQDCEDMYRTKNMNTIINDGRIINFEKENNND